MSFEFGVIILLVLVPLLTGLVVYGIPRISSGDKKQDDASRPAKRSGSFKYRYPRYKR